MDADQLKALMTSLNQTLASLAPANRSNEAIVNLSPPTFSGSKSDDVVTWLEDFESATIALDDVLKKKLLSRAFTGSARAWFRTNLEGQSDSKTWADVKELITKRYKPDAIEYYVDRLKELKFSDNDTLESYVDQRIYLTKMVNPSALPDRIVRETIKSLPPLVKDRFNMMRGPHDIKTTEELSRLASQYDRNLSTPPEEQKPDKQLSLNAFEELISKAISKSVENIRKDIDDLKTQSHTVAAAISQGQGDRRRGFSPGRNYNRPPPREQLNNYNRNNSGQARDSDSTQGNCCCGRNDCRNNGRKSRAGEGPWTSSWGTCRFCNGEHWNRDCPTLNANGRRQQVANPRPSSHSATSGDKSPLQ